MRNCWKFYGFFGEFIKNFLGIFWRIFWRNFFGRIFLEKFFGRIFWEDFLGRNSLFVCQDFVSMGNGRKEEFRSLEEGSKLIALKNQFFDGL